MKIVLLTHRVPYPPFRGDALTIFGWLRALRGKHQISLGCFAHDAVRRESLDVLRPLCDRLEVIPLQRRAAMARAALGLASWLPSQLHYFDAAAAREPLSRLFAADHDVAVAHSLRMAPLVIERTHAPAILWLVDSIGRELSGAARYAPFWQRPLIRWERHRVDRATSELTPRFAETWVVSEDDRDDLVRMGCERVEVVPIGLDDGLFELPLLEARNSRVGFVGNLAVNHNVDAALLLTREIFPLIRVRCPSATLTIAGANPGADLQALCRRRGVELPGAQPSLLPWWGSVGVLVAPLRFSAGVQYKVLEAMAAGVPTVTTPRVAAGLEAEAGKHLLTAATNAEFAEGAAQCLRGGPATFERMRRARDFVRDRFNWSVAISRMSEVTSDRGLHRDRIRPSTQ